MNNGADSKGKGIKWTLLNQLISFPLNFIFNIFSKRILGALAPMLTGATVYFNSFQQYIDISLLPVVSGISRNIPTYIELNDHKKLEETLNVSSFLTVIILSGSILSNVFLFFVEDNAYVRILFLIGIIIAPIKIIGRYINVYLGGHKKFSEQSKLHIVATIISISIGFALILIFFDWGYIVAISLLNMLPWFFLFILFDFSLVKFRTNIKSILIFLKSSLPIFIISISDLLVFTFDKILLKHKIGLTGLGFYGFAFQIHNTIFTLVGVVFGTLFPYLMSSLVHNQLNPKKKHYEIIVSAKRISTIVTTFIIFSWLIVSILIDFVIPAFEPSKNLIYFTLFVSFLYSIQYPFYVNLLSSKKDGKIISISIIYTIITLIFLAFPYDIGNLSVIFTIIILLSYALKSLSIIIFSLVDCRLKFRSILKSLSYILVIVGPLILYNIILENKIINITLFNYFFGFVCSFGLLVILIYIDRRERKFYFFQIKKLYLKVTHT